MKKIFIAVLFVFISSMCAWSKPGTLKFNEEGKFKILQLTDLHMALGNPKSDIAYENIKNVVAAENPDLILVTGDLIYSSPAKDIFNYVMDFLSSFNIPYAITFGNHDHQFGLDNDALFSLAKKYPLCLSTDVRGLTGTGNCEIGVKGSNGKDALMLYCFDSGDLSPLKDSGVKGYSYIHADQIAWYVRKSKEHAKNNGGQPLPSLAFFHIPFPEYSYAINDDQWKCLGHKGEKPCAPLLNTGLFAAMKERGDVMGTFCGHDHDNDYAVNYYGILLSYGRFTGGDTEYNNLKPNGARVIELKEGAKSFDTWIRLRTGEIEQKTTFPTDFKK